MEVLKITDAHVDELELNIRQEDLDEINAIDPIGVKAMLDRCMDLSYLSGAMVIDGELLALFGVAENTILTGEGIPWLISTNHVLDHRLSYAKECKKQTQIMKESYRYLQNFVDARYHDSIKWLVWLGYSIRELIPFGVSGLPFYRFDMEGV